MRKLILTATVALIAGLPGRLTATQTLSQPAYSISSPAENVAAVALVMELKYDIPAEKFMEKVQKGEVTLIKNAQGNLVVKSGGSILAILEDF